MSGELISNAPLDFLDASSDEEETPRPPKRSKYTFIGNKKPAEQFKHIGDPQDDQNAEKQRVFVMEWLEKIENQRRVMNEPLLSQQEYQRFTDSIEEAIRRNKFFPFWNSYVGGLDRVNVSAILQAKDYQSRGWSVEDVLKKLSKIPESASKTVKEVEQYSEQMKDLVVRLSGLATRLEELQLSYNDSRTMMQLMRRIRRFRVMEAIANVVAEYSGEWQELKPEDFRVAYMVILASSNPGEQNAFFDQQLVELAGSGEIETSVETIQMHLVMMMMLAKTARIFTTDLSRPVPDIGYSPADLDKPYIRVSGGKNDVDAMNRAIQKTMERMEEINYTKIQKEIWKTLEEAVAIVNRHLDSDDQLVLEKLSLSDAIESTLAEGSSWLQSRGDLVSEQTQETQELITLAAGAYDVQQSLAEGTSSLREISALKEPLEPILNSDEPLSVMPQHERAVDDALMYVHNSIPQLRRKSAEALMLNPATRNAFAGLALYNYVKNITLKYPRQWRPVRTIDDLQKDATRYIVELVNAVTRGKIK